VVAQGSLARSYDIIKDIPVLLLELRDYSHHRFVAAQWLRQFLTAAFNGATSTHSWARAAARTIISSHATDGISSHMAGGNGG
jgi:hypothetical protein